MLEKKWPKIMKNRQKCMLHSGEKPHFCLQNHTCKDIKIGPFCQCKTHKLAHINHI